MSEKEIIIASKYKLGKKIGEGSFGQIYSATNIEANHSVAVKVEKVDTKYPQLLYEGKVLKLIQDGLGIPEVYWLGTEGSFNIMVLERLGASLEDLFKFCNRKFSLKTVLMIVDQMLCRIQYIHSKSFIHRDIKPDNFLIGSYKRCSVLYAIDFGLAKKYRDLKGKHLSYKDGRSLTGTARYASVNAHAGIEQTRRDDIESIAYVMFYFLNGVLPWQGINGKTRAEKYNSIKLKKQNARSEDLCKDLPPEFRTFLDYAKSLNYQEEPNYRYCRNLFKNLFAVQDFLYDYHFDWIELKHYSSESLHLEIDLEEPEDKKEGSEEMAEEVERMENHQEIVEEEEEKVAAEDIEVAVIDRESANGSQNEEVGNEKNKKKCIIC